MKNFSVIGKSIPKVDSVAKVKGEAKYADDLSFTGMLYGKILRSPYPYASIKNIDISKAKELKGVKGIITSEDTPKNMYGRWQDMRPELLDEYPLAVDKVRYIGDDILAVAAIDEETAEEALELISIDYEILPAVFDPEEAMKEDAPRIHDHAERNIGFKLLRHFGDVEKGFRESDYIFEDVFKTQGITHCALEPHSVLANFDSSGKLTVWSSTQNPFPNKKQLARALGMDEGNIRVIKPFLGGGFGGKVELLSLDICASLLSKKTAKPVKITYSREEVFIATRTRHPMDIRLKTGVKKDGTIAAVECMVIADSGAYNALGPSVMQVNCAFGITLPYRITNIKYDGYLVYTNNPVAGSVRGYGNPQMRFAFESQLDMIAEKLGMDTLDIRIKNAVQSRDITLSEMRVTTSGFSECIVKSKEVIEWDKKEKDSGIGISGAGVPSGAKTYIYEPYVSESIIKVREDGKVDIFTGGSDIGEGMNTALVQIAAEELGIGVENINIIAADTDLTPMDMGTSSSRGTTFAGTAVKLAATEVKKQVFELAADRLEANIDELEAKNGMIYVKGSPNKSVSFLDISKLAKIKKNGIILGKASYDPGTEFPNEAGKGNISPAYSFNTNIAHLNVDLETGYVKVNKIISAFDCGVVINPVIVEGQIEGGVSMGLGYALSEVLERDKGQTFTTSFLYYKVPTSMEMVDTRSILVQTDEPNAPFGAKGGTEGTSDPTAPAIANAIYNAVGVRIKELPITPENILRGLEKSSAD
ncbi:MAG TPA: molybdopterin cofactor-binding domain-containing protein [Syntrophales bacterium]|nr:molybdopterin cofactor-binding domain-containing protein [Syntrophales bacterium]